MKKLSTAAIGLLLILFMQRASAQNASIPLNEPDYNKPKLFADLPQRMTLRTAGIDALFATALGAPVTYRVADGFVLEGTVVSKSEAASPQVQSIVIRATNRAGATFTFTRTTAADGTIAYVGRILSRTNGDAFEIHQEGGAYVLDKKDLYDLLNE